MLTGKDLVEKGYKPGKWFAAAIDAANRAAAGGHADVWAIIDSCMPPEPLRLKAADGKSFFVNIRAENELEQKNVDQCLKTMTELMRTPVVKYGAVMPDACIAGGMGTIPVGGVAASEAIHPGMHSADICCSMALTNFGRADPARLMDAVHAVTHFGPTARPERVNMPDSLEAAFESDFLLRNMIEPARSNFATQGDGNHFAYVGILKSTGETILVTHHGSRVAGARLYKAGMQIAERFRKELSPETLAENAWIPADTQEGDQYWSALQTIRAWTKANHYAIHDMAGERIGAKMQDRFWNEHNFVFRKPDGLFYHGKGATPAWQGWADDAGEMTIIPLNMAEPILIVRGSDAANGLGFSPHGAGRNYSRTAHKRINAGRTEEDIFKEETANIDARFFMGMTDISELPSAYKNAAAVKKQIGEFGLAEIIDEVMPYGCIMAGDWEKNAPWRKNKTVPDQAS